MNLHENKDLFKDAVKFTAEQKHIKDIYVEKDYWVTFVLYNLYKSELGKGIVFKGGTALSKCYNIIERFSEDIDLIILKSDNQSDHYLKKKLKDITTAVSKLLPEIEEKGITHRIGMVRKTAHSYPKAFKGEFGQVRDTIIVEATRLGHHEPYETKIVSSYIYEMMLNTKQENLATQYGLLPFNVLALDIKRTLCEKIMSLVRFSYTKDAIEDLNNKIRHTYDIHQLLNNNEIKTFFNSESFDSMLLRVANDDLVSFKNNNEYLKKHPKDALLFSQPKETWKQLKSTYQGSFKTLVFGTYPNESEILKTLLTIAVRLEKIDWKFKFD
ncbi:nucleotidyl transferase AbiEii/AbiGii toxin family protein [Lutibacter sp. A64]|uniref:nucleotidyl transferase AbiEii/AbiGii toxin family protein n=1 Tax=Lutibacter sp. A64 TaxID=2918526 RepID=UPI001F060819|nr:nucleotidyl transferase AbiEii/AbiGii toxin family protein [Lutibacter sp. A64]UMB53725.1 nucleotidyl transferase AbiEii/AbiGii toxin family protein [Lutibacter sp. A64]